MNLAHVHLLLNHIPLISLPVALLFYVYGTYSRNSSTQRFALYVLLFTSLFVLPVFFTGEPAEDLVKPLENNIRTFIHPHEEAAEISLVLTLFSALTALAALWFSRSKTLPSKSINFIVIGVTLLAVFSLGYTASLGGQIRHSEIRVGSLAGGNLNSNAETQGTRSEAHEKNDEEKEND